MAIKVSKKKVREVPVEISPENLPRISFIENGEINPDDLQKASPESAGRALLHARRETERMKPLRDVETAAKARLIEYFESLPEASREPLLIGTAGRISYRAEQFSDEVVDVEALLKDMTSAQILATYKPDMKVLKQVLEGWQCEKHVVRKRVGSATVVPTDKGGEIA